mgnify:CR=1 FL=1
MTIHFIMTDFIIIYHNSNAKNFSQIVKSKSNIIRSMINDNKTDTQIINELKMPVQTFYTYKRRIQEQDAQIWEKIHIDSAKY